MASWKVAMTHAPTAVLPGSEPPRCAEATCNIVTRHLCAAVRAIVRTHERTASHSSCCAAQPWRKRPCAGASARLGDDADRARLRARRQHYWHSARLVVRRHVLHICDARARKQGEGQIYARRARTACQGQRRVAEGIRLLHLCDGRRQEGRAHRSGAGLLARLLGPGADAQFPVAVQGACQSQGTEDRDLRSIRFRRLCICQGQAGAAGRRAEMQTRCGVAARNDLRRGQSAEPDTGRPEEHHDGLGRAIRQQDPGALSLIDRRRFRAVRGLLLSVSLLLLLVVVEAAMAQPFGLNRGASPSEVGGFAGWILAKQGEFYRMLSGLIRAAKADGSAAYTLLGISFLYGVFHAAGPGHGKAVISSYLVANNETWRRGIILSFASAILQAFTAIAVVGVVAALLGATAKAMGDTVRVIEIVSYALILLIGLRLLWVKGTAFLQALGFAGGSHAHDHMHEHGHGHHHHHHHDHDHDHEASAWSHGHGPEPGELTGDHWLKRGLTAIVAVGLRPCSGAIIVLVFALAQGLFWIGVASTFVMGLGTAITVAAIATMAVGARELAGKLAKAKPGVGVIILRGLETAAALVIVLFGAALLTGYLASERLMGV